MIVACSTSAFKMPLPAALAEVARLGFAHVDLICIKGWDHINVPALADDFESCAAKVEHLLAQHRLTPLALNMAFSHHLHVRSARANRQRLREADAAARLMQRLQIAVASFYPGYKVEDRPWHDVLVDTVATVTELLAVARAASVTFVIEPHFATPFQSMAQINGLLEAVPALRIAYDPSHFAMQALDLRQTEPLLDRAAHVHLRDAAPDKMQTPWGAGTVDIAWLLDALAARRYRGAVSIEYLPDIAGGPACHIFAAKERCDEIRRTQAARN